MTSFEKSSRLPYVCGILCGPFGTYLLSVIITLSNVEVLNTSAVNFGLGLIALELKHLEE
jgi:hypothetical protein